jgi:hypothetical protein
VDPPGPECSHGDGGDLDQATKFAEASLQVLNGTGDEGEGLSLLVHTLVAISSYDYEGAEESGRRALEVFRTQNHRWGVTTSLLVLARIARNRRSGTLQALLQESAPLVPRAVICGPGPTS